MSSLEHALQPVLPPVVAVQPVRDGHVQVELLPVVGGRRRVTAGGVDAGARVVARQSVGRPQHFGQLLKRQRRVAVLPGAVPLP